MQTNIKGLNDQLDLSQMKAINAESMITLQEVQWLLVLDHSPFTIEWGLV